MERVPLAERMRPKKLADIVGQAHLLGKNEILQQIVKTREPVSLILWGPPGSGKTTLARVIANEVDAECIEISAVSSGKKDVEKIIGHARQNWNLHIRTLLFVDEIHRFNKAQQDAFLPHVEDGTIILIGATTENPSFEVISPLLSRSRVLILRPLTPGDITTILQRAIEAESAGKRVKPDAINYLAQLSGGDARSALGTLELALALSKTVTVKTVQSAAQSNRPAYDKKGDMHYGVVSAFIKSMRGSDVNATLYYLARMIEAGEDPKFIARRMIIFASEDIGLAGNGALGLALNAFQAVERVGMPESKYILFHVATALAKAEKSRVTTDAMGRAESLAKKYPKLAVPLHVQNAPTKLMKEAGYGEGYKWQANYKHQKGFLPPEIQDEEIFN